MTIQDLLLLSDPADEHKMTGQLRELHPWVKNRNYTDLIPDTSTQYVIMDCNLSSNMAHSHLLLAQMPLRKCLQKKALELNANKVCIE